MFLRMFSRCLFSVQRAQCGFRICACVLSRGCGGPVESRTYLAEIHVSGLFDSLGCSGNAHESFPYLFLLSIYYGSVIARLCFAP